MNTAYKNQQQTGAHTQNMNTGYNPEPMISLSTFPSPDPTNVNEQWKHYLTNISPSTSSKLTIIGILYVLIAIIGIGLEIGLLINGGFSWFFGFFNGFFLFSLGVLTLSLCRQQVYVLTSLYVLAFFQILFTILTCIGYSILYYIITNDDQSPCSFISGRCVLGEFHAIVIADLIHVVVTFCILIMNFVIIANARQPPVTPTYVVYAQNGQPMPASFHNPRMMVLNQTTSA